MLEAAGDLGRASQAAQTAVRKEPTDWQVWLTLARIESEQGADRRAVQALARSHALNRLGPIFTTA